MSLLLYTGKDPISGSRLQEAIERVASGGGAESVNEFGRLVDALKRLGERPEVAVLQIADLEELSDLLSIGDLLSGIRLVLILPDFEHETTSMAHRLRPRYLAHISLDYVDVIAVLNRMFATAREAVSDQNTDTEVPPINLH